MHRRTFHLSCRRMSHRLPPIDYVSPPPDLDTNSTLKGHRTLQGRAGRMAVEEDLMGPQGQYSSFARAKTQETKALEI